MFDTLFDCTNVRNSREAITKAKPFVKPYELIKNKDFTWLMDKFSKFYYRIENIYVIQQK